MEFHGLNPYACKAFFCYTTYFKTNEPESECDTPQKFSQKENVNKSHIKSKLLKNDKAISKLNFSQEKSKEKCYLISKKIENKCNAYTSKLPSTEWSSYRSTINKNLTVKQKNSTNKTNVTLTSTPLTTRTTFHFHNSNHLSFSSKICQLKAPVLKMSKNEIQNLTLISQDTYNKIKVKLQELNQNKKSRNKNKNKTINPRDGGCYYYNSEDRIFEKQLKRFESRKISKINVQELSKYYNNHQPKEDDTAFTDRKNKISTSYGPKSPSYFNDDLLSFQHELEKKRNKLQDTIGYVNTFIKQTNELFITH